MGTNHQGGSSRFSVSPQRVGLLFRLVIATASANLENFIVRLPDSLRDWVKLSQKPPSRPFPPADQGPLMPQNALGPIPSFFREIRSGVPRYVSVMLIWMAISWGLPVRGQSSDPDLTALIDAVDAAVEQLDASLLPDLASSQQHLLEAMEAVEADFAETTTLENAAAWRRYLNLEPLREAIRSEGSTEQRGLLAEQVRLAKRLQTRLSRNFAGLERPAVETLRDRVEALRQAIRFRNPERTILQLAAQLKRLAELLRAVDRVLLPEDVTAITTVATLLEQAGQGDLLSLPLNETFANPNVVLLVDESLIQQAVMKPVLQQRAVNECLLGTRLIGTAVLRGEVSADLQPSAGNLVIDLQLRGTMESRNTGYNGPVRVQAVGDGNVGATRRMWLTENGIELAPTTATATLKSQICKIEHPWKLVRRIAAKRAADQKPLADAISRQRLENRIRNEFTQQTDGVFGPGDGRRLRQALKLFRRINLTPPERQLSCDGQTVRFALRQREAGQIGAAPPAPAVPSSQVVTVQVYESAINNLGTQLLAGRTLSRAEVELLLGDFSFTGGEESVLQPPFIAPKETLEASLAEPSEGGGDSADDDEPADDAGQEPNLENETTAEPETGEPLADVEVEFAEQRPLIFEARDGRVRVGIRGTRFRQGDTELQRALEITAAYRPVSFEEKTYLLREGPVEVDFGGRRRLGLSEVAIKTNLERAFEAAFPIALLNRSIRLPFGSATELSACGVECRDGWFSVSYR